MARYDPPQGPLDLDGLSDEELVRLYGKLASAGGRAHQTSEAYSDDALGMDLAFLDGYVSKELVSRLRSRLLG